MPSASASSPLEKFDDLMKGFEVSDKHDLPPASPTMSAAPHASVGPPGKLMKTNGVDSLGEEQERQTSLEEDLEEQERQRWLEDGEEMWRQASSRRHLPDDFSDPAPHLTDLEKHRKRVRILLDENGDGTRNWGRVQMSSKEKESEDQESWSRYGDRVSFGSYDVGQDIPASDPNEEIQQQRPNSPSAQARQVLKQQRTDVPTLRGGHLEATNMAEAQETTNVPKVEKGTRLIRTPGVLTVEQAEIFARLASVGLRPQFAAPPAPASPPVSEESAFRYAGYHFTNAGDMIQPFPTERSMERDPMMSVNGLVHSWAAKPHEKVGTAAESASMSQSGGAKTGDTRVRDRVARGGAAIRGKGRMVRGGQSTRGRATTRGGGEARGGCHTALPQQAPPGQTQRSSNSQDPSTMPMHDSSFMRGQNSHHVHVQMGEMERPPVDRVQQPLGPINGHVHSNGIPQGRPSGFMPMTRSAPPPCAMPENQLGGPQQRHPNSVQRQEDVRISSRGPILGTSYTFPSLEGGLMMAEDGDHQRAIPNQAQRSPVMLSISNSRMALPPPLFPYGKGRHGEYNMQMSMPPLAQRDSQHSLPTPPQQPAMPRATPKPAESGPQQPLPSPSSRPAMPPSAKKGPHQQLPTPPQRPAMPPSAKKGPHQQLPGPSQRPAMPPSAKKGPHQQLPTPPQRPQLLPRPATAPTPWPWVQPQHNEGRAGRQSGQVRQPVAPPLLEEGASQTSAPAQHSQLAVPGTAVIDFALVAQKKPS